MADNNQEIVDKIIETIKKVPEKRLMLIELANSIPIKNGMLDIPTLQEKQGMINLATVEAQAYGSHTIMVVDLLIRLRAKENGAENVGH